LSLEQNIDANGIQRVNILHFVITLVTAVEEPFKSGGQVHVKKYGKIFSPSDLL